MPVRCREQFRHPHKHPHNFSLRHVYSRDFTCGQHWPVAPRVHGKQRSINDFVHACDHAGLRLTNGTPELITQRSVVQIHPPQPIKSAVYGQQKTLRSDPPTYSPPYLSDALRLSCVGQLTIFLKFRIIGLGNPDSSDPRSSRGTRQSCRRKLESWRAPLGAAIQLWSFTCPNSSPRVLSPKKKPQCTSASPFQPSGAGIRCIRAPAFSAWAASSAIGSKIWTPFWSITSRPRTREARHGTRR